jgi:hypothetical protein
LNGQTVAFSPKLDFTNQAVFGDNILTVNVETGGGASAVNIAGLPAGVALNVNDGLLGGHDTVIVGSNGTLAGVAGTVYVSNNGGQTSLIIDDEQDTTPRTVTLNNSTTNNGSMTFPDVTDPSGNITITYPAGTVSYAGGPTIMYQDGFTADGGSHGVTSLIINGSIAGNTYTVDAVAQLTDTTINGSLIDTVNGPAAARGHFSFPLPRPSGQLKLGPAGLVKTMVVGRRHGGRTQALLLVNPSDEVISGPLYLVLAGLPKNMHLKHGAGKIKKGHPYAGAPYLVLPVEQLNPGQSLSLELSFSGSGTPHFTPTLLAGPGVV